MTHGTLATIYRQRGCFEDCEAVLDVELEVLTRYKRSSEGAREAQVCASCRWLITPNACGSCCWHNPLLMYPVATT